eukprot:41949_1
MFNLINDRNKTKTKSIMKEDKYGKGGMMFSVGCCLMSETDMGNSYEIEVFLYPSFKYTNAKCLCIIATSQGTTGNVIEMGSIQKLKFAQNTKECDWGIERFDISTKQGRINERTGKSAETDMIIYFIPVQENVPYYNPTSPTYTPTPIYPYYNPTSPTYTPTPIYPYYNPTSPTYTPTPIYPYYNPTSPTYTPTPIYPYYNPT